MAEMEQDRLDDQREEVLRELREYMRGLAEGNPSGGQLGQETYNALRRARIMMDRIKMTGRQDRKQPIVAAVAFALTMGVTFGLAVTPKGFPIQCPTCMAKPYAPCRDRNGKTTKVHRRRKARAVTTAKR
jgi:hypothetical protein